MFDAIVTWRSSKRGAVKTAHYVLGEPSKREARALAIELHDLDEGTVCNRHVVIVKAKTADARNVERLAYGRP